MEYYEYKIKNCPFCDGDNIDFGDNWIAGDCFVRCNDCGGFMNDDLNFHNTALKNMDLAIFNWNFREDTNERNVQEVRKEKGMC